MNKICTSIEQSKKLIELELDVKTADMYWDTLFAKKPEAHVDNHHLIDEYDDEHRIPAWSLSALLELIPEKIPGTKLVIKWDGSYYIEGRDCLFDNAIDAAFEMVCWLKENNKL